MKNTKIDWSKALHTTNRKPCVLVRRDDSEYPYKVRLANQKTVHHVNEKGMNELGRKVIANNVAVQTTNVNDPDERLKLIEGAIKTLKAHMQAQLIEIQELRALRDEVKNLHELVDIIKNNANFDGSTPMSLLPSDDDEDESEDIVDASYTFGGGTSEMVDDETLDKIF